MHPMPRRRYVLWSASADSVSVEIQKISATGYHNNSLQGAVPECPKDVSKGRTQQNKIFDPAGVAQLLHYLNNSVRFRWNRCRPFDEVLLINVIPPGPPSSPRRKGEDKNINFPPFACAVAPAKAQRRD